MASFTVLSGDFAPGLSFLTGGSLVVDTINDGPQLIYKGDIDSINILYEGKQKTFADKVSNSFLLGMFAGGTGAIVGSCGAMGFSSKYTVQFEVCLKDGRYFVAEASKMDFLRHIQSLLY